MMPSSLNADVAHRMSLFDMREMRILGTILLV